MLSTVKENICYLLRVSSHPSCTPAKRPVCTVRHILIVLLIIFHNAAAASLKRCALSKWSSSERHLVKTPNWRRWWGLKELLWHQNGIWLLSSYGTDGLFRKAQRQTDRQIWWKLWDNSTGMTTQQSELQRSLRRTQSPMMLHSHNKTLLTEHWTPLCAMCEFS